MSTPAERIDLLDWRQIDAALDAQGFAPLPRLLGADECTGLVDLYRDEPRFRSRIEMERFRFGVGEYKYFAAPLPPLVQALREALYGRLAPAANRWMASLNITRRYPAALDAFLRECHRAGQRRPTPLLLRYVQGGYNCLHQDIYGDVAFPLQVVLALSRREIDYTGGEFLLVEQRPRAQSRGHAMAIEQGAGVVFSTRERPAAGARGAYRVILRHGVSTVTGGTRFTLGIIFHDAK
jgi:hypothetical protein